jgi:hypothetical protein
MNMNKILKFLKSKIIIIVIVILFSLALLVGTFSAGMAVGYRKARFSYAWGENYHRNFGGPREGFLGNIRDFVGGDFIEGHGAFGQIVKIDNQTIILKGRDNVERIITVKDDTSLERFRESIKLIDLKIDDYIIVLGSPNNLGQIEAKFIRVMPIPLVSPSGGPINGSGPSPIHSNSPRNETGPAGWIPR